MRRCGKKPDSYGRMGPRFRLEEGEALAEAGARISVEPAAPTPAKKRLQIARNAGSRSRSRRGRAHEVWSWKISTKPGMMHPHHGLAAPRTGREPRRQSGSADHDQSEGVRFRSAVPRGRRGSRRHRCDRCAGHGPDRSRYQAGCARQSASRWSEASDTDTGHRFDRLRRHPAAAKPVDGGHCRRSSCAGSGRRDRRPTRKRTTRRRKRRPTTKSSSTDPAKTTTPDK